MNDATYEALLMMIELCPSHAHKNTLNAALDMLCDVDDSKWYRSSYEDNMAFVKSYMTCNFVI